MICASLAPRTREEALAGMDEARRAGADLAEIRGDALEDPAEFSAIVRRKTLPVLATFRSSEDARFRLLEDACAAGADYVDVDHREYREFPRGAARLVLSYHDFERTPADLESIAREMRRRRPFLVKIAVRANGAADLLRCVRLQKSLSEPSAVIAMGECGEPLRFLYRRCGGFLTFAALRPGAETAPGQPTVADLASHRIGSSTDVYAVVGRSVSHSRSPALFNAAFRAIGRDAFYVRLPLDDPALFRELVAELELRGVSVTIPHKETVVVDDRDEDSREIGALNTVVVRGGRFVGYNTDAAAALDAIGPVEGRRALVLGAGGAARAIAWGLRRGGASVVVSSRSGKNLGCDALAWDRRGDSGAEIVINATSVGMNSDETPFPAEGWRRGVLAFDAVYTPRETRFLREARAAGARTVEGMEMFLRQADRQFRLFTGEAIPAEILRQFRGS